MTERYKVEVRGCYAVATFPDGIEFKSGGNWREGLGGYSMADMDCSLQEVEGMAEAYLRGQESQGSIA